MTDEYKERIIKWLTGNYTIEPSTTDPLFQDLKETTTDINNYIETVKGYIKGKDGKGNDLDIGFIYGNDSNDDGVILVVDDDFNIIEVITEYDSGTAFGQFVCLNIDKTNGNIYGIDISSSKYRFILLNNFLIKTPNQQFYTVKLRQSYFLEFTNSGFVPKYVEKRPSDSFYVMVGMTTNDTTDNQPMVATYKIEVGSTNELEEYTYTETYNGYLNLKAYNITWSGEEYLVRIGCMVINAQTGYYNRYANIYSFDGTTITRIVNNQFGYTIPISEGRPSIWDAYSGMEITNTEYYYYYNYYDECDSKLVKYQFGQVASVIDYDIHGDDTLDYTWTGIRTIKVGNTIYFYGYENTTDPLDNTQADFNLHFGVVGDQYGTAVIYNKVFEAGKIYNLVMYNNSDIFTVSNLYNLSNYILLNSHSTTMVSVKQIYNPLNDYNWEDWQNELAMIPYSAWLYNNNEIIYARNLYNKVVSGNTTTSTVEVPNLLLNDIDIEQQDLLGESNGILVSNIGTIQKNIYEDLYINFYNTLTMQNQNTQEYITNIVGASRLNGSISSWSEDNEYDDVKLTKIRINYSDNTSLVKAINPATRISQFVYQYSFNIYVPGTKDITNIEMISQDESTVYQTITGLSLERSKSYNITQNVEIGE